MKKLLSVLLTLCMLLVIVAACDSTDKPSTDDSNTTPPAGATTPGTVAPEQPVAPIITDTPEEGAKLAEHISIMNDGVVTPVINAFNGAGSAAQSNWVYTMITDRLVWYDETINGGTYVPQLATRWETSDNQTYTFYLRDDATFHNGEHFTAADVKWTIEISREFPGTQAGGAWGGVAQANIINDYTIEIVLSKPSAGFIGLISNPYAGIYNAKAYAEQPDTWTWIGTGPYYVSSFSPDIRVDLTRFDDFWGGPAPTKSVSFGFVPEEAARPIMLLDDSYQFSLGILPDDLYQFDGNPDYQQLARRLNSPISLGFNVTDPQGITSDLNFRMAVAYALNGLDVGLVGEGDRGCSEIQEGGNWGYATPYKRWDLPRIQQNLDTAKQYLDASSWNGEVVEIAALPGGLARAAEMIQEQLRAIGLETKVNVVEYPQLAELCQFGNNRSQMHVFPSMYDLDPFMAVMENYTTLAPARNFTNYSNPEIEALLAQAEAATDTEVQRGIFSQVQQIVENDMPHFALFWKVFVDVARSNIGGFVMSNTSPNHNFRGIFMLLDD